MEITTNYINRATSLHLELEDDQIVKIKDTVLEYVCQNTDSDSYSPGSNTLFIWIINEDLFASTSPNFPNTNSGLLVFINEASSPSSSFPLTVQNLRFMILSPRTPPGSPTTISSLESSLQRFSQTLTKSSLSLSTIVPQIPNIQLVAHDSINTALSESRNLSDLNPTDGELNTLQLTVNSWIRQIQTLTHLVNTPPPPCHHTTPEKILGPAEEKKFWSSLLGKLKDVENQLDTSPGVVGTVLVLRANKRFLATTSLENNTNLTPALSISDDINNFLKDYQIEALLTATVLSSVSASIEQLFTHVMSKARISKSYTLPRIASLVSSTSFAVFTVLKKILSSKPIMSLQFPSFSQQYTELLSVSDSWTTMYRKFTTFYLDHGKRRGSIATTNNDITSISPGERANRIERALLKTSILAIKSREMAADIMATSTTKLTHPKSFDSLVSLVLH